MTTPKAQRLQRQERAVSPLPLGVQPLPRDPVPPPQSLVQPARLPASGSRLFQGGELHGKEGMEAPHSPVRRAEWNSPDRAMGGNQPVEGVTRPSQLHGSPDQGYERDLVDDEPGIFSQRVRELLTPEIDPPNLGQKLNFQEGDRRDSPRTVFFDPRKSLQPIGSRDDPDYEVSIQKDLHGLASALRGFRPSGDPSHSQPHSSASPASRTWINSR